MSELVDKDAFLKQERKWYCENCDRRKGVKNGRKCFVYEIGEVPCRACDVDDVLDDLECFETIDAVPVVRCGECRYRITAHGISDGWVLCSKPYTERGNAMHRADWFCADGERREG